MIHCPADIWGACHEPVIFKRFRLRWTLNDGNVVDLTDRVVSVGEVRRTLAPLLGGYKISNLSFTVRNDDGFLNPFVSTSLLGERYPETYLEGRAFLEQAILGRETGWYYFPIYEGPVGSISGADELVEFSCTDPLTRTLNQQVEEDVILDPARTPSEEIQDLLTSQTTLTVSDLHTASFSFAHEVQEDLEWRCYGRLRKGSSVYKHASELARCGAGVLFPDESGLIRYDTIFPNTCGDQLRGYDKVPVIFRGGRHGVPGNSTGFRYLRNVESTAAEIAVQYQGTFVSTVSFDRANTLGFRSMRRVSAPYLATARCAELMGAILWKGFEGYVDVVKWVTHGLGLCAELNDRVDVEMPGQTSENTYRVTSKAWSRGAVEIEAVRENSLAEIADATFGQWDVTNWLVGKAL